MRLSIPSMCFFVLLASGCSGGGSAGADGKDGKDGSSATVTVGDEPAGPNCAAGGKEITVQSGARDPVITYVCNGTSGAAGTDGNDGSSGVDGASATVTVTSEPAGSNCASGGKAITTSSGSRAPVTSYVCNGADGQPVVLTAEPAGSNCANGGTRLQVGSSPPQFACNGGLHWNEVSAPTQAVANNGYISSSASPITLTLPPSSALAPGDELRLLVQGAGEVSVAPGAGQRFQYRPDELALATTWTRQSSLPFSALASSADGARLVAAHQDDGIYTSIDRGLSWTKTSAPALHWEAVASSADGTKLAAVSYAVPSASLPGAIYVSSDSGQTWQKTNAHGDDQAYWLSVTSSADGSTLAAGTFDGIYVSTDSGQTWTQRAIATAWGPLACSSDGSRMVAAMAGGAALIYTSSDAGANWAQTSAPAGPGGYNWQAVASSSDGTKLAAVAFLGGIYLSADGGANWTKASAPDETWISVASSADGSKLVALALKYQTDPGGIYTSTDYGATWTEDVPADAAGRAVASSADGASMVVAGFQGVSRGGTGALVAHPSSVLDLVYAGQGVFFIADVEGIVEAP